MRSLVRIQSSRPFLITLKRLPLLAAVLVLWQTHDSFALHVAADTPKAYSGGVFTFIESSIFERVLRAYLDDDDEYRELQQYLIQNPEAGEVIPGSGGLRKLRWARPGAGKRGGLRIIYLVRYRPNEFWMLTLYAKAKRENIPAHILKQLLEAFTDE